MHRLIAVNTKAKPQPLAQGQNDIRGTQQQIPAPQSPGLHAQPKEPLQSAVLHPLWGLAQGARKKRKGRPHRHDRHPEPVMKFIGPGLLPGTSQSHKDDLRPRLPYG